MSIKPQITFFSVNMQPFFLEKRKFTNQITFEDSEENIISDDTLVSEEQNNFFLKNAPKTLNINENWYIVHSSSSITDAVDKAVKTYKNHSTILLMKQKLKIFHSKRFL